MIMDFINSLTFGQFLCLEIFCVLVAVLFLLILFLACGIIFIIFNLIVSKIFGISTFDVLDFARLCNEYDLDGSLLMDRIRLYYEKRHSED